MSLADDILAGAAVPIVQHLAGQAGTMKGPSVDDLAVTGMLGRPSGNNESGETGERDEESWTWTVAAADVSSPGAYNELVTDGETWSIEQPPERPGGAMITYRVTQVAQAERTLPGYRRG